MIIPQADTTTAHASGGAGRVRADPSARCAQFLADARRHRQGHRCAGAADSIHRVPDVRHYIGRSLIYSSSDHQNLINPYKRNPLFTILTLHDQIGFGPHFPLSSMISL